MTDTLLDLESESMYVLREAYRNFANLAMLWSMGKDSTVLLWLARKAFLGHVPFPLIHIDTSYKIPAMIEFRDRVARDWNLPLIVARNEAALSEGRTYPNQAITRVDCCSLLKKDVLKDVVETRGITGLIVGVRRDEEPTRAKERYFSPRTRDMVWHVTNQPPEFWGQFTVDVEPGEHVRVHPLLHWSELDVWRYIDRERIPVLSLYFADERGYRYRSLGCAPCTAPIRSNARSAAEIVAELSSSLASERAGRAQDHESEDAFERLRRDGYM